MNTTFPVVLIQLMAAAAVWASYQPAAAGHWETEIIRDASIYLAGVALGLHICLRRARELYHEWMGNQTAAGQKDEP